MYMHSIRTYKTITKEEIINSRSWDTEEYEWEKGEA